MVEAGFSHDELNAMDEEEFIFLLELKVELEEARNEAAKAVSSRG